MRSRSGSKRDEIDDHGVPRASHQQVDQRSDQPAPGEARPLVPAGQAAAPLEAEARRRALSLDDLDEYDFMACRRPVITEDAARAPPAAARTAAGRSPEQRAAGPAGILEIAGTRRINVCVTCVS